MCSVSIHRVSVATLAIGNNNGYLDNAVLGGGSCGICDIRANEP